MWNRADEAMARRVLAPDVRFRGSLGEERAGPEGFIGYMRSVHAALAHYTRTVEDLVDADRAVARVRFAGTHRGELLGFAATGRRVSWTGAAFFTLAAGRISEAWVLGDLDGLKRQLGAAPAVG